MKFKSNILNLKSQILIITLSFFLLSFSLFATVYEPLHNDIYNFLARLSQKGIIQFNDQIKPIPRNYILKILTKVNDKKSKLTSLEKEELEYFLRDYEQESYLAKPEEFTNYSATLSNKNRFRLYTYSDDLFKLNLSPIIGYDAGSIDNSSATHRWWGVNFYGYIGKNIGFSFDFRDNQESGDDIDRMKRFTPETGINISKRDGNSIDYSEIKTTISYNWDWGNVSLGKEFFEWGYGESGLLVLSRKAPSFPFVRLDLSLADWLGFNYFHGFLSTDIVDTNSTYATLLERSDRFLFEPKYLASHTLFVKPFDGLDISLGESIVYSDRLEIVYLMPLMFFRLADHFISNSDNSAGGNSHFFLGLSSRNIIPNTHLYGSVFVDEIRLSGLFDSEKQRNQFAYSLGASVVDFPFSNLTLKTEYTRIFPFVYKHFIPTQTYENQSFILGHWMGHNSDQIYGSLNYRFLRGLQLKFWAQFIRKGEDGIVEQQYTVPSVPFLFGQRTNHTWWGFDLKYEIIHELAAQAKFISKNSSNEQLDGSFLDSSVEEFSFALYYGL